MTSDMWDKFGVYSLLHNFSTSNPWPFVCWNVWAVKNTGLIFEKILRRKKSSDHINWCLHLTNFSGFFIDIYVPKCWVDLSFNSREILDFLKFETEHFWIEINSVLGHIKIVTFDCTWFDVFIKFSTPNTDKLIPFFVNLTLIIACILTHFSGFFDCTCTWFDDFLKFSNPRGHFTPNSDNLIPFSVGKRFCLGKDLAEQEFYLFLTGLLHRQIYISQVL